MWWNDAWTGYGAMPWMLFGPLMMLIFLAVCIAVVFLFVRSAGGTRGSALDILRERYARGEIDQAEFEERRRVLFG